jgi:DNA-binding response OmpR family regulator
MRIWLIEDRREGCPALRNVLELAKHRVESFVAAGAALKARAGHIHLPPDAIMVGWLSESADLSVPERKRRNLEALGFIRELRRRADPTPLVLYASTDCPDPEVAQALDAGADDFITAPLARPGELLGRLRALRRRTSGLVAIEELRSGPISIDLAHCRVKIGGDLLALSALEYRLLVYLAERPGQVVSTDELLDEVFETPSRRARGSTPTRAPAMAVSRLRHKLGAARSQLVTLVGLGFMLDSNPVKRTERSAVDPRRERG